MTLLDKLKAYEKELSYQFFRNHLRHLIRSSHRTLYIREKNSVVRPYIFSHIFNRGVGLTTSLIRLSEEGKLKKLDHKVFIHIHYRSDFDNTSDRIVWYENKEDLYKKLSECESQVALVDVYNLDQENFRQYFSNNYNKKNRMILTFSTHGFV